MSRKPRLSLCVEPGGSASARGDEGDRATWSGGPPMSELNRGERLQIMLTEEELIVVDDWRFARRMPSRAPRAEPAGPSAGSGRALTQLQEAGVAERIARAQALVEALDRRPGPAL